MSFDDHQAAGSGEQGASLWAPNVESSLTGRLLEAIKGRSVRVDRHWVTSFVSASYLGFEQDTRVKRAACQAMAEWGISVAMPRVLACDRITAELEHAIGRFTGQPAALVYPSTTHVALDVLPALLPRPAAILVDAAMYPTHLEGAFAARRAGIHAYRFAHNDPDSLSHAISRITSKVRRMVVCNAIYPEGGHAAPLAEFASICSRAGAFLYVDDSHG